MSALLSSRTARRRGILFTILVAVTLLLMAFSSSPALLELQRGIGFAFRPMQAALDELYGLGHDYRRVLIEQVQAVTAEHITAMARKYFTAPAVAVVTPAPDKLDLGIQPTRTDRDEPEGNPVSQ